MDGCLDHSDALGGEHLVEAGCEFLIAIPDQERDRSTPVDEIADEVTRYLGDEGARRMVRDPEDVHFPGPELDYEEHLELLQGDGVHGEEVRGQDAVGLGTQELGPRRSLPRNGSESVATQDPTDRGSRDPDPQLE